MDIKHRIIVLEQEIDELRNRWKNGSVAMRAHIEQIAKQKTAEISVFKSVLRRRGELPEELPQEKLL